LEKINESGANGLLHLHDLNYAMKSFIAKSSTVNNKKSGIISLIDEYIVHFSYSD
jgi:hypothetical protein